MTETASGASPAVDDEDVLRELEAGRPHRFADFAREVADIPGAGAGIYTIWDDTGTLIYVGIAGRNPDGADLLSRLRSPASGRRSGDQLAVYVADRYVLPELTQADIEGIRDGRVSMDMLVREKIHRDFSYRFAIVDTYAMAIRLENAIKNGTLGAGPPQLNGRTSRLPPSGRPPRSERER